MQLDSENADHLFNMGQILTSIAEALAEDRFRTHDPLPLLAEAVVLFGRCLDSQIFKYKTQMQQAQRFQSAISENQMQITEEQQ